MKLTTLTFAAFALYPLIVPLCGAQGVAQDDAAQFKQKLAEQQKQIDALKHAIEEQQKMLDLLASKPAAPQAPVQAQARPTAGSPPTPAPPGYQRVGEEVASTTGNLPSAAPTPKPNSYEQVPDGAAKPLSVDIGVAKFTPFGFLDLTNVVRSTDVGGGIGTSFSSIPFNNTTAGHLSESRLSLQNSRLGMRIDSDVLGMNVLGYLETDFLGNAPTNLVQTSNSDVLRLRLIWVDMRKSKWEVMAGQSWSLLTPNKVGISPVPSDITYTENRDTNYSPGLIWTRAPQLRLGVHFNDHVAWAIAAENPEQFIGNGIEILPATSTLVTAIGTEFNSTTQTSSVPNLHPDIISKLAFDGKIGGLAQHFEVSGLYRTFQSYNPATNTKFYKAGTGASANFNLELAPGFHFLIDTFASDGGGRYTGGLGPDLIVRSDGSISPVRSYATLDGFEYMFKPKNNPNGRETLLYSYYGANYFGRDVALDTNGAIGYGVYSSAASLNANRAIQEVSIGFNHALWKNPNWGDLKIMPQYSYLWRDPWYVPASNAQRKATTNLIYINLRYDIP